MDHSNIVEISKRLERRTLNIFLSEKQCSAAMDNLPLYYCYYIKPACVEILHGTSFIYIIFMYQLKSNHGCVGMVFPDIALRTVEESHFPYNIGPSLVSWATGSKMTASKDRTEVRSGGLRSQMWATTLACPLITEEKGMEPGGERGQRTVIWMTWISSQLRKAGATGG